MRVSVVCKKSYDYVVVGGGFTGMNAVKAIYHAAPNASVLCIDKNHQAGGSWNHFYPFVKLHSSHRTFGVNGHPWHHKDRNALSTRSDILRHFNDFCKTLPSNFEFAWGGSCNAWHKRQDGRMDVDIEKEEGICVDSHCVIDARGGNYQQHMPRSACIHAAGINDVDEISMNELPMEIQRRNASRKETLYVVIGGGKSGMDAAMFVAENRGANDELTVITGRPKFFAQREKMWNPSCYNLFFPTSAEMFLSWSTEYDGTEACALQLLQDAGKSGLLLHVGEATPETWTYGWMSLVEKEKVKTSAQLVENDHFVRCEDNGGGRRRLVLSSGKTLETKKEVVLVNCRTSVAEAVWNQDLHPLRPDGSIRVGATLFGTTGQTAYGLTLLHLKGNLDVSFYGLKHPVQTSSARWSVERTVIITGNTFKLGAQLGNGEMGKMTLHPDYWMPAPRRLYGIGKMMRNADKIKAVCETTLEALQPFQQP